MKTKSPLKPIFDKLAQHQVDEKYLRAFVLPPWWNDDVASSPLGLAQAVGYIASKTGLDAVSLLEGESARAAPRPIAFKKPVNAPVESLRVAAAIASQAAQIATEGVSCSTALPATAAAWRELILSQGERVTFESLLQACWQNGVAVLSLAGESLPIAKKGRPHGLAARFENHFAVVLMGEAQHKSTPWQLFRLAHEVGHIALGHLDEGASIFDENTWDNERDPQETAADAFAVELLFGKAANVRTRRGDPFPSAQTLAASMTRMGAQFRVEEGAIALNWARTMTASGCSQNCWATANSALKQFPIREAHELVCQQLETNLNWEELSEEGAAFLRRVSGLEEPAAFSKRPFSAKDRAVAAA